MFTNFWKKNICFEQSWHLVYSCNVSVVVKSLVFLEWSLRGPTACLKPKRWDQENFGSNSYLPSWTSLETGASEAATNHL